MRLRFFPLIFLLALSCIDPYQPSVSQNVLNILVVDGFMNATEGTALLQLSHVSPISSKSPSVPERQATVSVESTTGQTYHLSERDSGRYIFEGLDVNPEAFYSLHIKTNDGVSYISDTIRVRKTPPLDSLEMGVSNDGQGLNVLLSTHDASGRTRFYAWEYVETHEYHAAYPSELIRTTRTNITNRTPDQLIYTCWRTQLSTKISIGTSVSFADDNIHRYPITVIPKGSPKISVRYSILVKQRAVGFAEFNYLDQLRKTTENLSSIFGTTPTQVVGNVHKVNDHQAPVMGYFSGSEVTQKRFFIERNELPEDFQVPQYYGLCLLEETCNLTPPDPLLSAESCVRIEDVSLSDIIIQAITNPMGNPIAYKFTQPQCGDCRVQGGITVKPDYW
jgi:Domain of unknown function (DUF4249)